MLNTLDVCKIICTQRLNTCFGIELKHPFLPRPYHMTCRATETKLARNEILREQFYWRISTKLKIMGLYITRNWLIRFLTLCLSLVIKALLCNLGQSWWFYCMMVLSELDVVQNTEINRTQKTNKMSNFNNSNILAPIR